MRRIVPQHARDGDARIVVTVNPHERLAQEDVGWEFLIQARDQDGLFSGTLMNPLAIKT